MFIKDGANGVSATGFSTAMKLCHFSSYQYQSQFMGKSHYCDARKSRNHYILLCSNDFVIKRLLLCNVEVL